MVDCTSTRLYKLQWELIPMVMGSLPLQPRLIPIPSHSQFQIRDLFPFPRASHRIPMLILYYKNVQKYLIEKWTCRKSSHLVYGVDGQLM